MDEETKPFDVNDDTWAQWEAPGEPTGERLDHLREILARSDELERLPPEEFADLAAPWVLAEEAEAMSTAFRASLDLQPGEGYAALDALRAARVELEERLAGKGTGIEGEE